MPKLDTFVLLRNEGLSMDKKDGYWSGIKHGDGGAHAGKDYGPSSGDFRTLKPPLMRTSLLLILHPHLCQLHILDQSLEHAHVS